MERENQVSIQYGGLIDLDGPGMKTVDSFERKVRRIVLTIWHSNLESNCREVDPGNSNPNEDIDLAANIHRWLWSCGRRRSTSLNTKHGRIWQSVVCLRRSHRSSYISE